MRWGNVVSSFIALEYGVRQGGVWSSYHFTISIDAIIEDINKSEPGCKLKNMNVGIIIYANDIILLAHLLESLQKFPGSVRKSWLGRLCHLIPRSLQVVFVLFIM